MTVAREGTPAYEKALRAIGRHLDSETAYQARVLEVEEGLTVQFHVSPNHVDARTVLFPWERLDDLLIFNSAGRGVPGKSKRRIGLWSEIEGGREDFYRALGNKLDLDAASAVSVDELSNGVALSYTSPGAPDVPRGDKHCMTLSPETMRTLQAEAQSRRGEAASSFPKQDSAAETTAI